jgi:hypothetical protein
VGASKYRLLLNIGFYNYGLNLDPY